VDLCALLHPYIEDLNDSQLAQVSTYLDLLLRWNAKTNLTSIRDVEHIVTRHFGESFFLARKLFQSSQASDFVITSGHPSARDLLLDSQLPDHQIVRSPDVLDLGSGAGFPAIPLLVYRPDVTLTLVEAHHTKAVFLREVLRALKLDAEVKNVRAESLSPASADLVTLRAVEKFESILPTAVRLVRTQMRAEVDAGRPRPAESLAPGPSESESYETFSVDCPPSTVHCSGLALLISSAQIPQAQQLIPEWRFRPPIPIPNSQNRVIQLIEPN
jgi:16S rRNA (guanine527-N7)-methyltransferase